MTTHSFASSLDALSGWRRALVSRLDEVSRFLGDHDLSDAAVQGQLDSLREQLGQQKLIVAFVAEFSRGKSELINAIFFADYGRRLLPSSSGRTTMCPTELQWDRSYPPQLMLLPIETRSQSTTVTEYKRFPEEWQIVPLEVGNAETLAGAFQRVRETKLVPIDEAKNYALFTGAEPAESAIRSDGTVEIPCWRHAVVNFPHPILEQGLVILDTPGLNAIGTEPELTLNLLPNAHAVLFMLALDTGVTKSDLAVWRDFIVPTGGRDRCRLAVLNKIDTLWDGLRSDAEIDAEILGQINYVSDTLGIEPANVYPVSAQRALVARINGDDATLERSRLRALEQALSTNLIPRRQELIRAATRDDIGEIMARTRRMVELRVASVVNHIGEIQGLKGRNLNVVAEMVRRVRAQKADFDKSLATFQNIRRDFAELSNGIFEQLGMDALNDDAKRTLVAVKKSSFTSGVRSALARYFDTCRTRLGSAADQVAEAHEMMSRIYQRFEHDHGLRLGAPPAFSLLRYQKELDRLERLYQKHFDTLYAMLTNEALTLLQKFFETIASQVRKVFTYANREAEVWLRAVIAPMETQITDHQQMLRRRLDSIRRVHESTDSLDERLHELEHGRSHLMLQIEQIDRLAQELESLLAVPEEGGAPIAEAA